MYIYINLKDGIYQELVQELGCHKAFCLFQFQELMFNISQVFHCWYFFTWR